MKYRICPLCKKKKPVNFDHWVEAENNTIHEGACRGCIEKNIEKLKEKKPDPHRMKIADKQLQNKIRKVAYA